MSSDRFADRFEAETYSDDPVVGVYESTASEPDSLWIPERLFSRLVLVARAYELHTLPLLGGTDPVRLERAQCQSLLDEIAFVADRLADPLAATVAQSLTNYISAKMHRPGNDVWVTFEGE